MQGSRGDSAPATPAEAAPSAVSTPPATTGPPRPGQRRPSRQTAILMYCYRNHENTTERLVAAIHLNQASISRHVPDWSRRSWPGGRARMKIGASCALN